MFNQLPAHNLIFVYEEYKPEHIEILLPEERLYADCLNEKRKMEFTVSRAALRYAFNSLGRTIPQPLIKQSDEKYLKVDGFHLSLAHSGRKSVVIVKEIQNNSNPVAGIGVDIECTQTKISYPIINRIGTEREKDLIKDPESLKDVIKLFSVKESIYKAFYSAHTISLGFKDIEVYQQHNGLFNADIIKESVKARAYGEIAQDGEYVITYCLIIK